MTKLIVALLNFVNAHKLGFNPLTAELNPFAERYLKRFFNGDFAS
jgi:hypothetical protein